MTTTLEPVVQPDRRAASARATAVEQSRAVAEVQAAIVVAQQCPATSPARRARHAASCAPAVARREGVLPVPARRRRRSSGPSVQLARELARCWGNIQYGLVELRRDDELRPVGDAGVRVGRADQHPLLDDVHRPAHARHPAGPKPLTDMRDIYENNANNGARRLREMIFADPARLVHRGRRSPPATRPSPATRDGETLAAADRQRRRPASPSSASRPRSSSRSSARPPASGRVRPRPAAGHLPVAAARRDPQEDEFPPPPAHATAAEITGDRRGPGSPPQPRAARPGCRGTAHRRPGRCPSRNGAPRASAT